MYSLVGWLAVLAIYSLHIIWLDIRFRKVANSHVLLMGFMCCTYAFLNTEVQLITPLYVLVSGLILSKLNLLGAGDSKLLAAYSLAIAPNLLFKVVCVVGISGGGIATIYALFCLLCAIKTRGVPYSIAITIGGLTGIIISSLGY